MFQCSQCEKVYQRKTHLARHEATRKGISRLHCDNSKSLHANRYPAAYLQLSILQEIVFETVRVYVSRHRRQLLMTPREVTRRHSKLCAAKHNQPCPPAARPGRKRQSCELCFAAKAACDRNAPCSRCLSLGRSCTFEAPNTPPEHSIDCSPSGLSPSSAISISSLPKNDPSFSFLRHFTNPSIKQDRLAIAETAKCSMRRNLETLYSHLEDALIPTDPMAAFLGDMRIPEFSLQLPSTADDSLLQFPTDPFFPSKLSNEINELMGELVETSKSMIVGNTANHEPLDISDLASLFEVSHIYAFISAFFHSLHWHLPVVHFPTFDPGDVSKPLLLSIFLSGAAYTNSSDGTALSPWLFDVAEEYIFRKISNLSTTPSPDDPTGLVPMVQLIQAALIMEMFQFGRDDMQTRRRIRIIRHPCLVSTIRSLGMFQLKRSAAPAECDDWTWKKLVAEEVCIRYATLPVIPRVAPLTFDLGLHAGSFSPMDFSLSASKTTQRCQYSRWTATSHGMQSYGKPRTQLLSARLLRPD